MKSIKYKDCDLQNKINSSNYYDVYHDDKYLYKINKLLNKNRIDYNLLYNLRLLKLSRINITNCIFPDTKIKKGIRVVGARSSYINGKNLIDFFNNSNELYTFLNIVYTVSLIHQEIHSHCARIVIGDTNFSNVLYDNNNIPYLVDFEDCGIGNIQASACSKTFTNYCKIHGSSFSNYTQMSDIFSTFLEFVKIVFNKSIDEISKYELDDLAEKSKSIANIREYIIYLQNSHGIYKIPYLHEFISDQDFNNKELVLERNYGRML